jgi:hypothetical protein
MTFDHSLYGESALLHFSAASLFLSGFTETGNSPTANCILASIQHPTRLVSIHTATHDPGRSATQKHRNFYICYFLRHSFLGSVKIRVTNFPPTIGSHFITHHLSLIPYHFPFLHPPICCVKSSLHGHWSRFLRP